MIIDFYQISIFILIFCNKSYRREEIIDILKHRFVEKLNANIPIFGIDKSDLREFTTTERDMKRGTTKFPPN